MKIAVLSDIHSNVTALNAIIEDIEQLNIKNIIIAGDLIGDGPHPKQVLQKIRSLSDWVIMGNRDAHIIKYHNGALSDWDKYKQMAAMVWTYKQLDDNDIRYIEQLPNNRIVKLSSRDSILIVHGSPTDMYEHLYPNKSPERLEKAVNEINEDILVCGHTHQPWSKKLHGKLVVNPGSVGVHFNRNLCAEYAILYKADDEWVVEHRLVKYDFNHYEKSFIDSGLYDYGRTWVRLLLQGMRSGENSNLDFLKYAYDLAESEGYYGCKFIPNEIWDTAEKTWDWSLVDQT